MRPITSTAGLIKSALATSVLLLAAGTAAAQGVNLTAAPATTVLPDGQSVPMWGYSCGTPVTGSTATCAALNPAVQAGTAAGTWSPIVITVPYTADVSGHSTTSLTINLTNNLNFANGNAVPTSLVIVGQLGGGLGTGFTTAPSPAHAAQGVTWFASGPPDTSGQVGGDPNSAGNATFNPPPQPDRVQSFATEVAPSALTPTAKQVASPGVLVWNNLRPGTYLIESGTHPSIQGPMGLYGVLVVTQAPASATVGCAYPGATLGSCALTYDADVPLLLSEIDAVQNNAVSTAVGTAGFAEGKVWSGQAGKCGDLPPSATATAEANTCYPPAVNYSPRYSMINGVAFDRTKIGASTFATLVPATTGATVAASTGTVVLRFVNAGLRMHVPSVVNAAMTLYAEDGNLLPGVPRKQNEVFLAAGKTYDAAISPALTGTNYSSSAYAVYDRQLSLSNNSQHDGGMQAYVAVAGGTPAPASLAAFTASSSPVTKPYYCASGQTLSVSDPAQGLIGGVAGASGVTVGTPTLPAGATLTVQPDGTFTYVPPATGPCGVTFAYSINGIALGTATITACDATTPQSACGVGKPTAVADSYTSPVGPTAAMAARLHIAPPGVLANDFDSRNLALSVDTTTAPTCTAVGTATGTCTVSMLADGSFTANVSGAGGGGQYQFSYVAKNSQGVSSSAATVTLTFPAASNLSVSLVDAITGLPITSQDYRWIIEEDRTFWVDPACQVNSTDATVRPATCPPLPVQSLGYSFHTAYMPVVATGCVGPVSCEVGQTLLGASTACDQGNGVCQSGTGAASQKVPLDPSQVALDPTKRYFLSIAPADGINPTLNGAGAPIVLADGSQRPFQTTGNPNPGQTDNNGDCTSFVASIDPNVVGNCGHTMGGIQVSGAVVAANAAGGLPNNLVIKLQRTPLPTAQITAFVFEDDYPVNGENDAAGPAGANGPAPYEAGLGSFNLVLFDQAGGLGDATGQPTYDMFNQPLTNSLAGMIDPLTGYNACPLTKNSDTLIGMIPTCPKYEDGVDGSGNPILSPLVGQAVIKNLYPGLYEVQAFPGADRIAAGEEWLQTNTLDGAKPHEAFVKPAEPGWFQEFGPGGFHVTIGFANPKIINDRRHNSQGTGICDGNGASTCTETLYGQVTGTHMSRTPDQRTYSTGDYTMYGFTQCYVAIGPPDGADFAFAKCDPDGKFEFSAANGNGPIPPGDYKLTVFDQWNDIMLDGLVNPVCVGTHLYTNNGQATGTPVACENGLGKTADNRVVFPVTQWRTNLYTRTFIDTNGDGVSNIDGSGNPTEPGLALASTNIRYRDGSFGFFNNTDLNGFAGWNEVFPFMNWLVAETTSTRFKQTGTHIVYDAGGPVDGTAGGGNSTIAAGLANTLEQISLPLALRAPGSVYCTSGDCTNQSIATGPYGDNSKGSGPATGLSSGRIDPPAPWGPSMGFQSLLGQSVFMEFGMRPMLAGENGGIQGHVIYASTRPFDDPQLLLQLSWEPGVPRVQINLYQEGTDPTNGEPTLKLVDTTMTTSWDDWAQGFRTDPKTGNPLPYRTYTDAAGNTHHEYVPNMNCPGQDPTSPFFATLKGSTQWLDSGSHPGVTTDRADGKLELAESSQFKCYDGWSQLNQVQPAPYDGKYTFPSIVNVDPVTGRPAGTGATAGTAGSMAGTNCTICTASPGDGWPMLPPGKYVVEVVVPKGFELVKEEDKNILMGDIYVAPVTVQFPGVGGSVFIMPDQAAVGAAYNKNNPLNATQDLGSKTFPRHEGDTGSIEAYWPCVGALRTVPDYNSLYPGAGQNSPFAGAQRRLCDRKEVVLEDQSTALAKFYVFTPAHIAGHFTGTMTNDFASEFDPFSPQFGEKFGPPNLPVGLRDFAGNEMVRVYADQWGIYNGLFYSTWEVNPPNPTGYAPQMAIACMNDPGKIPPRNALGQYIDPATGNPVAAPVSQDQWIVDPAYNPAYSNFCYETPFMPGFTAYMDTPVLPTQAFADGYNLPDAEYPEGTPAVDSVIGDVQGPWVSAAGHNIVISCLGKNHVDKAGKPCSKEVQNPDFSGPGASTWPYNAKTITRHYGFGATAGTVTIGGVTASCSGWSETQITCAVPAIPASLNTTTGVGSTCFSGATPSNIGAGQTPAQLGIPSANRSAYRCGELVITRADGKRSIDTVTVTVAGTRNATPTVVTPSTKISGTFGAVLPNPLQTAIDNATPGDLIVVAPGIYKERLIVWKPVRLQAAGPGTVFIDADAHPAETLDAWRRQVNCVFGLATSGVPITAGTAATVFDPNGAYTCPDAMFLTGDRQPFEPIINWDAAGNANLAQVLQEPTLMGAYEGAGFTVVGRGIRIPAASTDFWGLGASVATGTAGAFPDGAVWLTNSTSDCTIGTNTGSNRGRSYGTSNYLCNPSRIDGFSITNSSQGGGGIFVHSWGHYLDVGNNRIYGNHGTLSGGINLGNGETPGSYANDGVLCGAGVTAPCPPIPQGTLTNELIPLQLNVHARIHHNAVYNNASLGDALFSASPSGAGGVTISAGADWYRFDHNWIGGNLSTGDGGGVSHSGQSFWGSIDHNFIVYNQSTNPTLPTNGGGLAVIGSNNPRTLNGTECGTLTDQDCPPGLGDGTGKALVVDSNLIVGNSAESGSGGGLRLQQINGTELTALPTRPDRWYDVTVTNNIIVNNVAGWDGGGVSMEDAFRVSIVNNTIASNDSTSSAGVLFKTLNAPNASSTPPGCTPVTDPTLPQNQNCISPNAAHNPQPAGLVTTKNTPNMVDALVGVNVVCPSGYGYSGGIANTMINANCRTVSIPVLTNDLFWQNRAFHIEITGAGTGLVSQQNLVAMIPILNQTKTGFCAAAGVGPDYTTAAPTYYWDVGVRDDVVPNDGAGGARLSLNNSVLTPITNVTYGGSNNRTPSSSPVVYQYCNGSRVPPENGGHGFLSPPGASETTGLAKLFTFNNIQPAATVDEGNNWINLTYGPLTLASTGNLDFGTAASAMVAAAPTGPVLGAYSIGATSPAVNGGTTSTSSGVAVPSTDFFGNPRSGVPDIGAVEFQQPTTALGVVNPGSLSFAGTVVGTISTAQTLTLSNVGSAPLTGIAVTVATTSASGTGTFQRPGGGAGGTCGATLAAGASCTINVTYAAPATANVLGAGTVSIAANVTVLNAPVALTGSSAARTYTASIGPSPLAFGTWATGTTSSTLDLHVTNTGNSALTNFTYAFSAGGGFTRVNTGGFTIPNCPTTAAGTLNPGASCTIRLQFAPTAATAYSRTLTVGANGGTAATTATFAPPSVTLTGAGTATRATLAISPNPLTITLPTGTLTGTGTVTLTNTAATGGAQVTVSNVTVSGASLAYAFTLAGGSTNTCTGATLPPGGSCTVDVRFTTLLGARGVNRAGTITFTDNGAGSPQSGSLIGFATP